MIRRHRTAKKTFHGKEGDLENYSVKIKYYLFGWCWRTLSDEQTVEERDSKKNGVGYR